MSTLKPERLPPRPVAAEVTGDVLDVTLHDGRRIIVPIDWFPRLRDATEDDRQNFELMPFGIHWPELDEDISTEGLLSGAKGIDRTRSVAAE